MIAQRQRQRSSMYKPTACFLYPDKYHILDNDICSFLMKLKSNHSSISRTISFWPSADVWPNSTQSVTCARVLFVRYRVHAKQINNRWSGGILYSALYCVSYNDNDGLRCALLCFALDRIALLLCIANALSLYNWGGRWSVVVERGKQAHGVLAIPQDLL